MSIGSGVLRIIRRAQGKGYSVKTGMGSRNRLSGGTYELVVTALITALVFAGTSFFKIPTIATQGYVHLGDAILICGVMILGRRNGTAAAALGSGLADVAGGYAYWAPWTFLIKGVMAFVFASIAETGEPGETPAFARRLLAYAVSGALMVAGYYLAASVMYGSFLLPLSSVPWNLAQAVSAAVVGEVFVRSGGSAYVKTRLR